MALGILLIMNSIIVLGVLTAQFFLYKEQSSKKYFVLNTLFGVLISLLVFTSLPTNFLVERIFTLALGALALIAFYLYTKDQNVFVTKVMLSIAIVGNLIQLFI